MELLKIGTIYNAIVKRVLAYGIVVETELHAITAVVHAREIEESRSLHSYKSGEKIQIKVIDILTYKEDNSSSEIKIRYVLSIRHALSDPWDNIEKVLSWEKGSKKIYSLQVDRLTKTYASGEIKPGVTGLILFGPLQKFFNKNKTTIDEKKGNYLNLGIFLQDILI